MAASVKQPFLPEAKRYDLLSQPNIRWKCVVLKSNFKHTVIFGSNPSSKSTLPTNEFTVRAGDVAAQAYLQNYSGFQTISVNYCIPYLELIRVMKADVDRVGV